MPHPSVVQAQLAGKRLESGKCPQHGITLVRRPEAEKTEARVYGCPQCEFSLEAPLNSRMVKLLR